MPADVARVTVTDYEQVALQLGVVDLASELGADERADFWRRAETETVLLADGLLRPVQYSHWDPLWKRVGLLCILVRPQGRISLTVLLIDEACVLTPLFVQAVPFNAHTCCLFHHP